MRLLDLPACKPVSSKKNPLVLKYMAQRVLYYVGTRDNGFIILYISKVKICVFKYRQKWSRPFPFYSTTASY